MTREDFYRDQTELTEPQRVLLEQVFGYLSFLSTISGAEVTLYTLTKEKEVLQLGKASPRDSEELAKAIVYPAYEFPLWVKAVEEGASLTGLQEKSHGRLWRLAVFPIVDNGGKTIGGLAFVGPGEEEEFFLLAETAYRAVMVPDQQHSELYEPLSYREGILIFNAGGTILYANEVARHLVNLLGFDRRLVGASIFGGTLKLSVVKQALASHKGALMEEVYGDMVLAQYIIPVIAGGKTIRSYLILKDRTEYRKAEQALLVKNSVIKEVHHRVKNNLQTVAGLLRMQGRRSTSEEVKQALQESIGRIESMALVHDIISHYDEDFIDARTIAEELLRLLQQSFARPEQSILCEYQGTSLLLTPKQGSYISLVLNELITNAFKHGLREEKNGHIIVSLSLEEGKALLTVQDNGGGLPVDFNAQKSSRLGLQILRNLAENELKGSFSIQPGANGGVEATLAFSYEEP